MAPNFLSTENVDGIGESSARLCCFAYQSKNQLELARATEPQLGELFSLKMSAQPVWWAKKSNLAAGTLAKMYNYRRLRSALLSTARFTC